MTNETIEHKVGKAIIDYLKSKGITDLSNFGVRITAEDKNSIQELGTFSFKDAIGIVDVQVEEDPTSPEGIFSKGRREPEDVEVAIHTRVIDEFKYGSPDEYGELDWFDKIVIDDLKSKGYDTSNLDKVDLRKMTTIDRLGAEEQTPTQLVETKAAIKAYEDAVRIRETRRNTSSLSEELHHLQHQELSDSGQRFEDTITQLKEAIKKLEK